MTAQETQGDPGDSTIHRLCQLGGVSRAGYYRHFDAHAPARADADLRDAIQRLSLAHRHMAIGGSPPNCGARGASSTPSACCG